MEHGTMVRYCNKCGSPTTVKDSRDRDDGYIRRRRECSNCNAEKFSTIEIPLEVFQRLQERNKIFEDFKAEIIRG